MEEMVERTPEQQAAIERRKAFLIEQRKIEQIAEHRRARARSIDASATAAKLLELRRTNKAALDERKTPAELLAYVTKVCIAWQIDPISKNGSPISIENIMARRVR